MRLSGLLSPIRLAGLVLLVGSSVAAAQTVPHKGSMPTVGPVESFELSNGMRFLWVDRPGSPMTAAVWIVAAGSASEEPGATGISHLLEHLLFRGTETIGRRTTGRLAARNEARLLEREDRLMATARAERKSSPELEKVQSDLRELQVKGEFARIYTEEGALGMNALTRRDLTAFWVMVPAPKLELWFWMESDRLRTPVLRDFYQELPVVLQERQQRIDSVPGGVEKEQFAATFWGEGHPYSWSPIGLVEDIAGLDRRAVAAHRDRFYRADSLTAVLVGDLTSLQADLPSGQTGDRPDPVQQLKSWAELYFGDLPVSELPLTSDSGTGASRVLAGETPAGAQVPGAGPGVPFVMKSECECADQIEVRFRTVGFSEADAVGMDLLAQVLSGRSGRLHREWVSPSLTAPLAFSAVAEHAPLRESGSLLIELEAASGVSASELEKHFKEWWPQGLDDLTEEELSSARKRMGRQSAAQVKEPLALALRLGVYSVLGDVDRIFDLERQASEVSLSDIKRLAEKYLALEKASFLVLTRRGRAQAGLSGPSPGATSQVERAGR